MNCRETLSLLPRFVDGELDARHMRDLAMHSARCGDCERELRDLEKVQELVLDYITAEAAEMNAGDIWPAIAPRLAVIQRPWWSRARELWEDTRQWRLVRVPIYAVAAAALLLGLARWMRDVQQPVPVSVAVVDNSVILSSIKSDASSVALISEPKTNTMVLWVSDDGPGAMGDPGGLP